MDVAGTASVFAATTDKFCYDLASQVISELIQRTPLSKEQVDEVSHWLRVEGTTSASYHQGMRVIPLLTDILIK